MYYFVLVQNIMRTKLQWLQGVSPPANPEYEFTLAARKALNCAVLGRSFANNTQWQMQQLRAWEQTDSCVSYVSHQDNNKLKSPHSLSAHLCINVTSTGSALSNHAAHVPGGPIRRSSTRCTSFDFELWQNTLLPVCFCGAKFGCKSVACFIWGIINLWKIHEIWSDQGTISSCPIFRSGMIVVVPSHEGGLSNLSQKRRFCFCILMEISQRILREADT